MSQFGFAISGIATTADANVARTMVVKTANNTDATNADGSPVTIDLLGLDSDAYKKAKRENQRARLARRNPGKITPEELEEEGMALMIAVTAAWTFKDAAGNPIPCTAQAVKELYQNYPDIMEQADAFVSDRGNVLKK